MTWLQAKKCKVELAAYLRQNNRTDTGYCGLSTTLARHIEEDLRSDNDLFAREVWGKSWADVFAVDVTEQFTPNELRSAPARLVHGTTASVCHRQNDGVRALDVARSSALGGSALERRGVSERFSFK